MNTALPNHKNPDHRQHRAGVGTAGDAPAVYLRGIECGAVEETVTLICENRAGWLATQETK
ncbi:MAG: hypothetical protein EOP20_07240 [Hyphomicrobiales bacterium]|nr:MAG: hypothetical protein EOP20_07240 [Hyphomicrobiales bacterium]